MTLTVEPPCGIPGAGRPRIAEIRESDVPVGDGYHLHVYETGEQRADQPTLVFLHGSGPGVSGRANWQALIEGLGTQFHCVAPDILGFADSSHPDPAPVGFKANAELRIAKLFTLLEHLGLTRVILVGNSMGGMYSLRMAQLRPDLVERMVLMGSGGMPGLVPTPALLKLVTFYDDPTPAAMQELFGEFVHDKEAFGPRIEEIAAQRVQVANRPEVRRSHLGMFAPGEFLSFSPEDLTAIYVRTLVVHGRNDAIVPLEAGLYLAQHLPHADLFVLGKCGHWSQIEQAERFRTILREFASGAL